MLSLLRYDGRAFGSRGAIDQDQESFYAAYVHDPDGNNIEAVIHRPE
jgi:predicted lactoylglutathione lyase